MQHHLSSLLASTDADVFKACLQTLSAFLRKSIGKHIIRDASLSSKLFAFTQGWGGKDEGLGLVACAIENVSDPVALELGSTLHFKFYAGNESLKENSDELATQGLQIIHLLEINTYEKTNLKLLRNTCMVDNMKNVISNTDGKFNSRATTSSRDFFSRRRGHTPLKQPLTKSRNRHASSYNLVDEDDDEVEEPMVWKLHVEKLSDCAHWSLGIICIPNKEDEMGPVILHLGSLGLHNSSSIFDNIRRNRMSEILYGYSVEEALGKTVPEIIISSKYAELATLIIQRAGKGETWSREFPVRNKNGERFTVITTLVPSRDAYGTINGVLCVSADVRPFIKSGLRSNVRAPLRNASAKFGIDPQQF
ncbi:E3 ubiquitin protein ligase UPL1-like protein [Tanacetum coccineum]